jgi:flagellum-specific ATP synthase
VYKDAEDLINIGAYKQGANPKIDKAVKLIDSVNVFLKQRLEEPSSFSESIGILKSITDQV